MLLDMNAYIGHWPFKQLQNNTCTKLLARMNRFGVDCSVISNINGIFYKNTQPANEELYKELKSDRHFNGRFIPFAVINPIYAGWRDDLETCVTRMGMKGLRIYPQYHDYEITHPSLTELVKIARDRGLPVAIDNRMVDSRQRSWLDIPLYDFHSDVKSDITKKEWNLKNILPLIRAVSDAKYMIVNVANGFRLEEEEQELVRKADILFDTSGRSVSNLPELLKTFGKEKFAFGSHSPFLDYLTGLLRIEALREDEAKGSEKEMLRFGNAKRMLGL